MNSPIRLALLALPLALACAADAGPEDIEDQAGGKTDTAAVANAVERLTADGELSAADVEELFDVAGGSVSKNEMLTIRDATESSAFSVTDAAVDEALQRAYQANLLEHEVAQTADASEGYGGIAIPEAVRALVSQARLNGAVAFDIRETRGDGEGRWSPYPSTTPPIDNMDFGYTVITPEELAADVANTQLTYNAIVGTETAEQCDTFGNCQEFEQARYQERIGGTGNIAAHYDEVHHPDLLARGSSGQKWASNCAFLSDGTIHCLPAARRSVIGDLILTNPHLSRCNEFQGFQDSCHTMLYMGHITASGGVINSIEVSGRVSKRIGSGKNNLIDPIALFDAWGFERSASLQVRFGNTDDGTPVTNAGRGILEAP
tara:strand:+ start:30110 stop:31237 length:1128 start_codon:yes stop_codon:yes gene_type:complete